MAISTRLFFLAILAITTFKLSSALPSNDVPSNATCQKSADIYFLLDSSSSVYILDFQNRMLSFVRDMVSAFRISPRDTRVGVVTFSDHVVDVFGLSEYTDVDSLLQAIRPDAVKYLAGNTNTGDAIKHVIGKFSEVGGARSGVAQVMVTVTDGNSQLPDETKKVADAAREKGIYMFAVGVGDHVHDQEIMNIASDPDEDFMFSVENFTALNSITDLLASKVCKKTSTQNPSTPSQPATASTTPAPSPTRTRRPTRGPIDLA